MALLSDLTALCAEHRVDSLPTLNLFARRLREAGRLSQKGRGRGAAQITFLDGARFLIACLATDRPEQAVDAEEFHSNFVPSGGSEVQSPFPIGAVGSLEFAVAKALEHLANGKVRKHYDSEWLKEHPKVPASATHVWLTCQRGGGICRLRLGDVQLTFYHPALKAMTEPASREERAAHTAAYARETSRFRTGKNIQAEFNLALLEAVATLIEGEI